MKSEPFGTDDVVATRERGSWWFPILLLGVLGVMVLAALRAQNIRQQEADTAQSAPGSPSPQSAEKTVRLQIDFGNGVTKDFATLAWNDSMTVADLMSVAQQFRPGITYQQQGEGPTAFLSAIDGIQPAKDGIRGWKYRVNGQYGQVSIGVHPLEPGDHVLWTIEANR